MHDCLESHIDQEGGHCHQPPTHIIEELLIIVACRIRACRIAASNSFPSCQCRRRSCIGA
jgi:hypothetical protein